MATTFLEAGTAATFGTQFWTGGVFNGDGISSDSSIIHTGPRSLKLNALSHADGVYLYSPTGIAANAGGRLSVYLYLPSVAPSGVGFPLSLTNSAGDGQIAVFHDTTGHLGIYLAGATPATVYGSTVLQAGTWFRVCIAWTWTSTTVNEFRLYLNGVLEVSRSNVITSAFSLSRLVPYTDSSVGTNFVTYFSDFYMDNSTSLADTGDIRVTVKRPAANNVNNFDTAIGANPANRWTNVNERPLSLTNGWQHAAATDVQENYVLEAASVGDINLPQVSLGLIARCAWMWAKGAAGGLGTPKFMDNGMESAIVLTASPTLYTVITDSDTYPSNVAGIGMRSTNHADDTFLYECGTLIAYIQNPPVSNVPTIYDRRLLGDPEVVRGLSDPLDGFAQVDEVTVELSNEDGFFNGRDLRGELLTLRRFDRYSAELLTEISGRVVGQSLLDKSISVRMASQDLDELQTVIPRTTITSALFSQAHQSALGQPIPIVFGNVKKLELPFVSDDIVLNRYDYLLGDSSVVSAATAVYRDTVGGTLGLVPPSEYTTVVVGSYRLIRFTKRQISFGGGLHRIYADLTGLATQRNFAKANQYVLQTVLGLSVNAGVFTSEAAKLDAIGSLFCDGVIRDQRPAMDYLRQLCQVRGMRLSKDTLGAWTITVDTQASTIAVTFGLGPDQPWRNVQSLDGVENTPLSEAIKTLYLDYRKEWRSGDYRLTVSRSVLSRGREERIQNDFISDSTTADKTVDYLGKRKFYEDQRIRFRAGQEARKLTELQLFRFDSPTLLGISNKTYRAISVRRSISSIGIVGVAWDPGIYVYSVGTIPAEPSGDTDPELANTIPTAATSLILQSSGVVETLDGGFEAFMVLQYTVPVETFAQTIVRFRRVGVTNWQTVAVNGETGSAKRTRVNGLVTGLDYDFRVSRVNLLNASLEATTDLLTQLAPGDTTAPAAPGTPTILDQHLKTITFVWTAPADLDVKEYDWDVRTAANGGGTLVKSGKSGGPKTTLTLNTISYGSARHFRVRAIDWSGNVGAYSSSVSFTFSKIVTGDIGGGTVGNPELGDGSVSTAKLIAAAVTTAIRQGVNSQSLSQTVPANTVVNFVFSVGTGATNLVTASVGGLFAVFGAVYINNNGSGTVTVSVWNASSIGFSVTVSIHYW